MTDDLWPNLVYSHDGQMIDHEATRYCDEHGPHPTKACAFYRTCIRPRERRRARGTPEAP